MYGSCTKIFCKWGSWKIINYFSFNKRYKSQWQIGNVYIFVLQLDITLEMIFKKAKIILIMATEVMDDDIISLLPMFVS